MRTGHAIKIFILSIGLIFLMFKLPAQNTEPVITYPKTVGYISIVHPLVTFDESGTTTNFTDSYTVGFPTGIHIVKNDKFGFSLEIVPFIKSNSGSDKVSNVLIHPGFMFRLPKSWIIYTRMAFETSGRYGITPSISKVLYKGKKSNVFASVPLPLRFGNNKPVSAGVSFQFGISF
ncbi:MAG: hypothetical protein Q8L90_03785 [Bacteroidota bacterium]|nr:hypothetical protein [Bacteroidota bacterium]